VIGTGFIISYPQGTGAGAAKSYWIEEISQPRGPRSMKTVEVPSVGSICCTH